MALAGYTNVGKSTLLNALTGAEVSVENRLFETLDPTTRGFEYTGKRYLVTDTVGFIRRLPTQLVEGFASTLEETLVADLVLHVADASLPRGSPAGADRRGRGGADGDRRRRRSRSSSSSTRSTASTRSPAAGSPTAFRTRWPSRRRPARGSTSCGRGSRSGSPIASRRSGCSCRTTRGVRSRRSTRSGRRSRSATDTDEGCSSGPGCLAPRGDALRPIPRRRRLTTPRSVDRAPARVATPIRARERERPRTAVTARRTRAADPGVPGRRRPRPGSLRAGDARARRARSRPHRDRRRDPRRATRGSSCRARGSPRGTASRW